MDEYTVVCSSLWNTNAKWKAKSHNKDHCTTSTLSLIFFGLIEYSQWAKLHCTCSLLSFWATRSLYIYMYKEVNITYEIHSAPSQLWLPSQVPLDQTLPISSLLLVWQQQSYHFHHLPDLLHLVAAKVTQIQTHGKVNAQHDTSYITVSVCPHMYDVSFRNLRF